MVLKYKGRKKLVKTIEDALSILDDNSPIAVGSRSAFYFIGSVSDYRRDIPLIEDHYRRKYEHGLIRDPDGAPYQSMADRTVREIRIRDVPGEPKALVLIVEGWEMGELWLLSEYAPAIRRYRNEQHPPRTSA